MGLFGGGNSKKTTNNTYEYELNNAAGNQGVVGDGNLVNTTTHNTSISTADGAFEFGESAVDAMAESQIASYDFAGGAVDRSFDAIESASEAAFAFSSDNFSKAMDMSSAARSEAFNAISESNKRISDVYQSVGRETASEALKVIKPLAVLAGLAMLVSGVFK